MKITPVEEILSAAGFAEPNLRALVPDENNYSVLLLQPSGHIEATSAGVRHQNRDLAHRQFHGFLDDAKSTNADLVVAPEYSMPWETLKTALKTDLLPGDGVLWAIGCESIKFTELKAIKEELAPFATVLFEQLPPDPERFVDPLAYVFVAPLLAESGRAKVVLLVQFKTCPMGDDDHFEIGGLHRGTKIYQFGGEESLRLISLICSDAFKLLDDIATAVYDRTLVIHLQLNPEPRQDQYRQYRKRLFRSKTVETELLCLNWARDVYEGCGENARCWRNISGTAWYLRSDAFDDRDAMLSRNHQRGLYYTWLVSMRSHVLFFNYDPASYLVSASKVAHIGVTASLSRRGGPKLVRRRTWGEETSAWIDDMDPSDGFEAVVPECGDARFEIKRIADNNPFEAERVLALCAGRINQSEKWHALRNLDSCSIEESEVILRITFCQDTHQKAREFRVARLKRCHRLWTILHTDEHMPPALADLKTGVRFEWVPGCPHQNVVSEGGCRATAIYMGEEVDHAQVEAVWTNAVEYLHRASADADQSLETKQRLAVWYRNAADKVELFNRERFLRYDEARSDSQLDIARAQ